MKKIRVAIAVLLLSAAAVSVIADHGRVEAGRRISTEVQKIRLEAMCGEQLKIAVEQVQHDGEAQINTAILRTCKESAAHPYLQLIQDDDKEFIAAIAAGKVEIHVRVAVENVEAMEGE